MSKFNFKLFKQLCDANSISGDEKAVRNCLKQYYKEYSDEIICDNLGSIVAYKKSNNPNAKKVLVLAHMDEVGFIVKTWDDKGYFRANAIGGINKDSLGCKRVILNGANGKKYYGVINASNGNEKIENYEFDFGFISKEEIEKEKIMKGDSICFAGETILMNKNRVLAKAIDDRYGCFLGVEVLKSLSKEKLDIDLYVGVSSQEEVGCRGATTIANKIKPDFVIVLDCSPSDEKNNNGLLGNGVLLRVKDASMLAFKSLIKYQKEVCKTLKANYQYYISLGGTDAGPIHKSYNGILTLTHCICAKNIHTDSSMIDLRDYEDAKKTLIYILKDLDGEKIESFLNDNR